MFAEIAIAVPLRTTFSYKVPQHLVDRVQRGYRVLVPFRNQLRTGIVVSVSEQTPAGKHRIRAISDVVDERPFIPDEQLALTEWIAKYYHAPIGDAVDLAVPGSLLPEKSRLTYKIDITDGPTSLALSDAVAKESAMIGALVDLLRRAPAGVDEKDLLAQVLDASRSDLRRLEALPGVVFEDKAQAKIKVQTATILSRSAVPVEKHLGAKQQNVLTFIELHGDTEYDELRELYGIGRQTVRSLEARDLITTREEVVYRDPFADVERERRESDPPLTDEQQVAFDAIARSLDAAEFKPILLEGVTGSGKTEVYLRAIRKVRARGGQALVLLPEISLTPQFVQTMRAALDDDIAVLHSQLTPGEKADTWRRILADEIHVVIGARSALFAPLRELQIIIVDEEHDSSFKQNDGVRYNARDAAMVLGALKKIPVLLGSATPSLETWHNARQGKYEHLTMRERVHKRPLPDIEYIDRKSASTSDDESQLISEQLQAAVKEAVQAGEQAILFLNRRGFAPSVVCRGCGETIDCASCDISMTYHQRGDVVRCHYCGDSKRKPEACPQCGADQLELDGAGTEQVEELVANVFKDARVARLDRDSSRGKKLHGILQRFRDRDADILVGTQMVTKGHDFPDVTVVGVLNADQSLSFPDLRSAERTFQLLTQVAGRAGRGEKTGRVLIQSWKPSHYVHQAVRQADFENFAVNELRTRRRQDYPPYGHLALFRFRSRDQQAVMQASAALTDYLRVHAAPGVDLVGPVDAPLARVRQQYRRQLLIRSAERGPLHQAVAVAEHFMDAQQKAWAKAQVQATVDIDPISML